MRIFTVVMGILLMMAGVYALFNMGAAFASLAFVLGIVMIAYGISQIGSWFSARKEQGITTVVLVEGIFTTLIGLLIVFYPLSSYLLAIWFAAWLTVSGVMRIVGAVKTKRYYPDSSWGPMMFMGVLTVLVGVYGIIHPVVAKMAIAMLLGIFFLVQGMSWITFGMNLPGKKSGK